MSRARSGEPMRGSDDMHSYLNAVVPGGVGGVFQDPDGTLKVYLTDMSRSEEAIAQLVASQQRDRQGRLPFRPGTIQAIQGRYDWAELRGWYDQIVLGKRMPAPVNAYDIDERLNRIRLVVSSRADETAIRRSLTEDGVPAEAVVFEIGPRPVAAASQQATDIQDTDSPKIRGGFAIRLPEGSAHCTLGFNVSYGANKQGFVTASHCGETWGSVSATDSVIQSFSFQPGSRTVADEYSDDSFFTNATVPGCPVGWQCRLSDAAIYEYRNAATSFHGVVANTVAGSRTLITPDWSVEDDDPHCPWVPWCGIVGQQQLTKVGSVTGRTVGTLGASCVNQSAHSDRLGVDRMFLCSFRVDGTPPNFVRGGKSGSAVFEQLNGANMELWGLLFAANIDTVGGATKYWFSSMRYMRTELGSFETVDEGPGGPVSRVPNEGRVNGNE